MKIAVRRAAGAGAIAALTGCAVSPLPDGQLALGEQAIDRAYAAGAGELAPDELARAVDKLAAGKRWIAARDYEPARWLLEQSRVDAELAAVKAASAVATRSALRHHAGLREGKN